MRSRMLTDRPFICWHQLTGSHSIVSIYLILSIFLLTQVLAEKTFVSVVDKDDCQRQATKRDKVEMHSNTNYMRHQNETLADGNAKTAKRK